jgi:hypothetical protein
MAELSPAVFLAEISQRLALIFQCYADGDDVATGQQLRLEGFIQAGLVLNIVSLEQVLAVLDTVHRRIFNQPFDTVFPPFNEADCIIAIPSKMQRAPVFPSTKD